MKTYTRQDIVRELHDGNWMDRFVRVEDIIKELEKLVYDIESMRGRGTLEATKLLKWKIKLSQSNPVFNAMNQTPFTKT